MTTKKAKNASAVLITADCPCGGAVMDAVTGSFDLTGEGQVCDTCEATIVLPKRVQFKP